MQLAALQEDSGCESCGEVVEISSGRFSFSFFGMEQGKRRKERFSDASIGSQISIVEQKERGNSFCSTQQLRETVVMLLLLLLFPPCSLRASQQDVRRAGGEQDDAIQ